MAEANLSNEPESLEIIDLDELNFEENDETWLFDTRNLPNNSDETGGPTSWKKWNMSDDPEVRMKKRSLVEKLDFIAKGSPTRFFASRPSMSSTPVHKASSQQSHQNAAPNRFDPRTFTRRPSRNLTFDKDTADLLADLSLDIGAPIQLRKDSGSNPIENDQDWKNNTFTRKRFSRESSEILDDDRVSLASSDASSSHRLNDVGDVQNLARLQEESLRQTLGLNSTFTKTTPPRGLNTTYQKDLPNNALPPANNTTFEVKNNKKDSRSSSQDIDIDIDRLSSTSDSSMSHRLNDLGDVQHLARMQEESLRQAVMSNNHRSATVSPSSENSPSTEGGHHDLQSEEGSYGGSGLHSGLHSHRNSGGNGTNYAQYSSQDSLPDSPYSSQSLDSQPANGQDRIGRSMPNLNKIRGQKKHSTGPPSSSRSGMGRGQMGYGLSASRHHNSDPRMIQAPRGSGHHKNSNNSSNIKPMTTNSTYQQHYHGVPSRGTVISRDSSAGSSNGIRQTIRFQSGIRPPTTSGASRIARPSTGIPRPGAGVSRLPAPTSGIPKPNSNPGSRASSASGPRKSSYCY